jgi:hypothetical protein
MRDDASTADPEALLSWGADGSAGEGRPDGSQPERAASCRVAKGKLRKGGARTSVRATRACGATGQASPSGNPARTASAASGGRRRRDTRGLRSGQPGPADGKGAREAANRNAWLRSCATGTPRNGRRADFGPGTRAGVFPIDRSRLYSSLPVRAPPGARDGSPVPPGAWLSGLLTSCSSELEDGTHGRPSSAAGRRSVAATPHDAGPDERLRFSPEPQERQQLARLALREARCAGSKPSRECKTPRAERAG